MSRLTSDTTSRPGCGIAVLITVLVVVAVAVFGFILPNARHNTRGHTISRWGTEYVAVLDTYGPVKPASGNRTESELTTEPLDDTRSWTYSGRATYALAPTDREGSTPLEARDEFLSYLTGQGWAMAGEVGGGENGQTYLSRDGGWVITVYLLNTQGNYYDPNKGDLVAVLAFNIAYRL